MVESHHADPQEFRPLTLAWDSLNVQKTARSPHESTKSETRHPLDVHGRWAPVALCLGLLVEAKKRARQVFNAVEIVQHFNRKLGMDATSNEAWKDAEATKKRVERLFQQTIPECPSGGVYSIVYGRQPHPLLPNLVCSLESACGHQDAIDYTVSITVKSKNGTVTVINLW